MELRGEAALDEADAADRAGADGVAEPLHGMPITVKESFNVGGTRPGATGGYEQPPPHPDER